MPLYGNNMTLDAVMRDFAYAFADKKYPGVPELELNEITLDPFIIGNIPILPIHVWHLKMPVYGFRFADDQFIRLICFFITNFFDAKIFIECSIFKI